MSWLSLKSAASYSGLCTKTLLGHIKADAHTKLPAKLVGGKWLIKEADLERWIESYPQPKPEVDVDAIVNDVLYGKKRGRRT